MARPRLPKSKKLRPVTCYIEPSIHAKASKIAYGQRRSLSSFLSLLIEVAVGEKSSAQRNWRRG